jgi:hypothetical protein
MATTTPNFGWTVPTSSDLVKNGATAIETLGDSIDASLVDLKGGTTNQVLAKNSNTDMDFKWVADASGIPATIIDAKGDLIAGTAADTASRLAVGANGTVLTADSAEATGLKWAAAGGGSSGPTFRAYRGSSDQSFSQGVLTKIQYNTEDWDTASAYDSTTNYRFTPTTAGYYSFNLNVYLQAAAAGDCQIMIRKNGSNNSSAYFGSVPTNWPPAVNGLVYLDGSSDYIEGFIYFGNGSPVVLNSQINSYFSAIWIRS